MMKTKWWSTFSLPILLLLAVGVSAVVTMSSSGGPPVGNLTVSKTAPDRPVDPLEVFSYAIAYANVGNKTETGIVLRETVPNLTRAVVNFAWDAGHPGSGEPCHKVPAGTDCFLELGTLPLGATGTAEFSVQVVSQPPKGVRLLENHLAIGNFTTGTLLVDDTATALAELSPPRLTLHLSDAGSTERGALHEYTLEVVNQGGQTAFGVALTETVPDHTTAGENPGWDLETPEGPLPCEGSGPASLCTFPVGDLPGGAVRTVPFTVAVDRTIPDGVREIQNPAAAEAADGEAATAELVTPLTGKLAAVDIPTLHPVGLGALVLLLLLAGGYRLRRSGRGARAGPGT